MDYFWDLLSFPESLPCIHVIKLLFVLLLIVFYYRSVSSQEPTRVDRKLFFLPDKGHVQMEAQFEVMQLQAKKCHGLLTTTRNKEKGKEGSPSRAFRKRMALPTP